DLDGNFEGLIAWSPSRDLDFAGIDRHRRSPDGATHCEAGLLDHETLDPLIFFGDEERDLAQLGFDFVRPIHSSFGAPGFTSGFRLRRGFTEGCPGARRAAHLLVALSEVEQGADPRFD